MQTFNTICYGVSGALIAGLVCFIVSVRVESLLINGVVFILFLLAPAFACILGGLSDYRIAATIIVYTLIGAFFFGATRLVVAVGPSHRELYHATLHLAGDIGAWREVVGGCTLAIGRILFVRILKETHPILNGGDSG